MFVERDFTAAIKAAREQLAAVTLLLDTAKFPGSDVVHVKMNSLSEQTIADALSSVPDDEGDDENGQIDYVYVIQVDPSEEAIVSRFRELLSAKVENIKEENKKLRKEKKAGTAPKTQMGLKSDYSKINPIASCPGTHTLYVGRSKSLRTRLEQHLGSGAVGVYSLHLQRWAATLDVSVQITYLKFDGIDDLLVQAIEDGIWSLLRPAFGRQGVR